MEAAGAFFALVARVGPTIVGYSGNFLLPHIHYRRLTVAINDVLFVAKGQRGTLGLRLMAATEEVARQRGARMVSWHAKPETTLDVLLARRGYRVQDVVYTKEL